jgi:copper(I)-binding protein
MPYVRSRLFAALAAGLLLLPSAYADPATPAQANEIAVHEAWARASAGNAATGAAYLTLVGGAAVDQVVGVTTQVAATAEVHESFTEGGIMKMRPAPALTIPAGKTVTLAPGGYHVMLMGLKQPLTAGQRFPLTVSFAHAAPVTVEVKVLGRGASIMDRDPTQMH